MAATDERLIYEILSAVSEIPEGSVATYGQIARLIGRPKNARLVGRVLSQAERYGDYPCHRVVDHSGRLVPGWDAQAALLRAKFGAEVTLLHNEFLDISSTEARRLLFFGLADEALQPEVLAYIRQNGLYGLGRDVPDLQRVRR